MIRLLHEVDHLRLVACASVGRAPVVSVHPAARDGESWRTTRARWALGCRLVRNQLPVTDSFDPYKMDGPSDWFSRCALEKPLKVAVLRDYVN